MNPIAALNPINQGVNQAAGRVNTVAGQVIPSTAQGVANQEQTYQQMQGLGSQLAQQVAGGGPNPAQAALAQATGQNVGAQNAVMAGVRGSAANPGLIAREAAQQGANTQQQAVGQAATLQAQQQIAAEQALQGQQQAQAALGTTQVNQGVNAANAAANAQLNYGQLMGQELQGYNQANVSNVGQANAANAGVQGATATQGIKGLTSALGFADGGDVPPATSSPAGPKSFAGKFLQGYGADASKTPSGLVPMALTALGAPATSIPGLIGAGVKALTSPAAPTPLAAPTAAETLPASNASDQVMAATGGRVDLRQGGKVEARGPKEKAVVKGNSYANDKIPAMVSEGETVIPRSVMQSKDPVKGAADFVAAVLAKRSRR